MMTSLMIAGLAVFVRCNCPILVLLRWDAGMLGVDLDVAVVEDDSTNYAKSDDPSFFLVDDLGDAMICLADASVLFLYDVVMLVLL